MIHNGGGRICVNFISFFSQKFKLLDSQPQEGEFSRLCVKFRSRSRFLVCLVAEEEEEKKIENIFS